MTHWTPDSLKPRSFWRSGTAIATIVWSMNVIATAQIIAASASFLFVPAFKMSLPVRPVSSDRRPVPLT